MRPTSLCSVTGRTTASERRWVGWWARWLLRQVAGHVAAWVVDGLAVWLGNALAETLHALGGGSGARGGTRYGEPQWERLKPP